MTIKPVYFNECKYCKSQPLARRLILQKKIYFLIEKHECEIN